MSMARQARGHVLMTLETRLVSLHLRGQLIVPCPGPKRNRGRCFRMHLVTGKTGEIPSLETGRLLDAVELPAGYPDHTIAPEAIAKKVRFGLVDEFLLGSVILFVRLDHEPLAEIALPRTKARSLAIEFDLRFHSGERPDAMTLPAGESRLRPFHPGSVRDCRIGFIR